MRLDVDAAYVQIRDDLGWALVSNRACKRQFENVCASVLIMAGPDVSRSDRWLV